MADSDGRKRAVIDAVRPELDAGRFPIKRTVDEVVVVEADAFCDGHDLISVLLRWAGPDGKWHETPMAGEINDLWTASFKTTELGRYRYTVSAWVDHFATWRHGLKAKVAAGLDVTLELQEGSLLVADAAVRAGANGDKAAAKRLSDATKRVRVDASAALDPKIAADALAHPDRSLEATYDRELEVVVDRKRAGFGSWYELFPRSWGPAGRHGTLSDVAANLDYVASMGFDVLYLPPIHPIGDAFRKGPNNNVESVSGDAGSPWAIGSKLGGHTAIHPDLGTIDDFDRLIKTAAASDIEVALDLAYQCSPDHPWITEHPQWFKQRPDGSIQYAENPPKKYQDIYPLNFETSDWRNLWDALADVVRFWIGHGVRIFRVDNPHTKSFEFWEWMINDIKASHPDVIFLAEAFTRPKVMYRLAKAGFTQSYTYFTWRNTAWEMREYLSELTSYPVVEFFRPNFWPNTPDILHESLQTGGRAAFMARAVLASTLGANWGIYGPAYELGVCLPVKQGSEEYLDSEKYQVRHWDLDDPMSLNEFISRLNRIRNSHPGLQQDRTLRFHDTDNDSLLAYTKTSGDDLILVIVNFDFHNTSRATLHFNPDDYELNSTGFAVHDLLTGARYQWTGTHHYVELDPGSVPAHVFHIPRVLTERDFPTYQ